MTKIVLVGNELHPVAEEVNVKLTSPGPEALITPLLLMVAVDTLLEVHVPASEAEAWLISPTHNTVSPVMLTTGLPLTVKVGEISEVHPVDVRVNWKVVVPAPTEVTNPLLLMVATVGFELIQIPPVPGVNEVFEPKHKDNGPV